MDSLVFIRTITLSIFLVLLINITVESQQSFDRIFSFGDSMADTGNASILRDGRCCSFPFGETYFHKPTGRRCDGRLIVYFIAQAYGLHLPPPSMGGNTPEYFQHGSSFAVAAALALNQYAYKEVTGLDPPGTDYSLSMQLQSFKDFKSVNSHGSNFEDIMARSLFLVGEIGGVDYIGGLANGKSLDEMKSWAPSIVSAISSAVNDLVNLGANTLIVPGNYLVGCAPWFLVQFQSNNTDDYDNLGCIKMVNELSAYHNTMLREEVAKQAILHPSAKIVYADY